MGKEVSKRAPSSLKVSKNENKQLINSLIKAMRPKVYITDSSSFKRLVQELTGNNETTNTIFLSSSSNSVPAVHTRPKPVADDHDKVLAVVNIEEDHGKPEGSSFTEDTSFEPSLDSTSFEICNNPYSNISQQLFFDDPTSDYLSVNLQEADTVAFQDFDESWLLDVEPYPFNGHHFDQIHDHQEDVSIYDYVLPGLL
ncbi:hypothetical protein K2173_023304 [Erythroxylum novogranatense]|uniref:VQ domain-containing protein n=1 Tax=Erythroxylum novogranatense TaxID=1862640 RepID=A0AAV8T9U7_9ROSI|nr:hypothetical protein K2173_023304 [Erythroxylum novogranatense]